MGLLELFKRMVNESLRIGIANSAFSLRRLSLLSYNLLACYDSPCCYKLCAISRASGVLASRKKSLTRDFTASAPYAVIPRLASCYNFGVSNRGLDVPVDRGN